MRCRRWKSTPPPPNPTPPNEQATFQTQHPDGREARWYSLGYGLASLRPEAAGTMANAYGRSFNPHEPCAGGMLHIPWKDKLTGVGDWVLVEADPVLVATVADVLAVHVAGVHLVVATRAFRDPDLHEARLGVLALGARDVVAVPAAQYVVQGRRYPVVPGVLLPHWDHEIVRVLAALPDAALIAGGVLEAKLVAAPAAVLVPGAVHHAVICGGVGDVRGAGNSERDQRAIPLHQVGQARETSPCL